jgi:sec-independent protein translocase protein TatA
MPIRLGPFELIIVLVIVIIIFGVGRLPEIGGAVGKAIREFRESTATPEEEEKKDQSEEKHASAQ